MKNWQAKNGFIYSCTYCGEQIGSGKYCTKCKTQSGRKEVFDENTKIFKENLKLGFTIPVELKNWK